LQVLDAARQAVAPPVTATAAEALPLSDAALRSAVARSTAQINAQLVRELQSQSYGDCVADVSCAGFQLTLVDDSMQVFFMAEKRIVMLYMLFYSNRVDQCALLG